MSRRAAAASDLTVKKQQIDVLSIAEGFLQSSVLFALLKLRIFERLDASETASSALAEQLRVRPETLARLLNAGVALGLLESRDGVRYCAAPGARAVLCPSAGENYLGDWIRSLDFFRGPLSALDEAVLKSAPTIDPGTHLGGDRESSREFALAMHNYASLRGKELAEFLDTTGCTSLLDVGCGPGTYAYHLGMKNAALSLHLADHPVVLETAREIRHRFPLENRVEYLPLDAVMDPIPGSYDLILVSNVLHGLGERASRGLIAKLRDSLNRGGALVIQAQFLRDDRLGGRWPVLLDLIQLCVTAEGRNHSAGETRRWMEEAGYRDVEFCRMTLLNTNSFLRGFKR